MASKQGLSPREEATTQASVAMQHPMSSAELKALLRTTSPKERSTLGTNQGPLVHVKEGSNSKHRVDKTEGSSHGSGEVPLTPKAPRIHASSFISETKEHVKVPQASTPPMNQPSIHKLSKIPPPRGTRVTYGGIAPPSRLNTSLAGIAGQPEDARASNASISLLDYQASVLLDPTTWDSDGTFMSKSASNYECEGTPSQHGSTVYGYKPQNFPSLDKSLARNYKIPKKKLSQIPSPIEEESLADKSKLSRSDCCQSWVISQSKVASKQSLAPENIGEPHKWASVPKSDTKKQTKSIPSSPSSSSEGSPSPVTPPLASKRDKRAKKPTPDEDLVDKSKQIAAPSKPRKPKHEEASTSKNMPTVAPSKIKRERTRDEDKISKEIAPPSLSPVSTPSERKHTRKSKQIAAPSVPNPKTRKQDGSEEDPSPKSRQIAAPSGPSHSRRSSSKQNHQSNFSKKPAPSEPSGPSGSSSPSHSSTRGPPSSVASSNPSDPPPGKEPSQPPSKKPSKSRSSRSRGSRREEDSGIANLAKAVLALVQQKSQPPQAPREYVEKFKVIYGMALKTVSITKGKQFTSALVIKTLGQAKDIDVQASKAASRIPITPSEWTTYLKFHLNHLQGALLERLSVKVHKNLFTSTQEFWNEVYLEIFPSYMAQEIFGQALASYMIWNEAAGIDRWRDITHDMVSYMAYVSGKRGAVMEAYIAETRHAQIQRVIAGSGDREALQLGLALAPYLSVINKALMAGEVIPTATYEQVFEDTFAFLCNWVERHTYVMVFGHPQAGAIVTPKIPDTPKPPRSSVNHISGDAPPPASESPKSPSYAQVVEEGGVGDDSHLRQINRRPGGNYPPRTQAPQLDKIAPTGISRTWTWLQKTWGPDQDFVRVPCSDPVPSNCTEPKCQYYGDWLDFQKLCSYCLAKDHVKANCEHHKANLKRYNDVNPSGN